MTALPIIEDAGRATCRYIPTNVIYDYRTGRSSSRRPVHRRAFRINVGNSVSRSPVPQQTPGDAPGCGHAAARSRQYRELAAFAQFGSDLDKQTQSRFKRGRRLVEILKQPQYQPLGVEKQVAIIYAATKGYLDPVPVEELRRYEEELYRYLETQAPRVMTGIAEKKILDDEIKGALDAALTEFGKQFSGTVAAAAVA